MIKKDIESEDFDGSPSILDCGAGDGRVLQALGDGRKYAIEKSEPLLEAMDISIFIVGTEFNEQTLIDKKCQIIYSNPPLFSICPVGNKNNYRGACEFYLLGYSPALAR